ncbi:MAG: galactose mutarotase [Bacteroidales bacterium]|nr:galactose mutarotase [Bacteroidales bacterium]
MRIIKIICICSILATMLSGCRKSADQQYFTICNENGMTATFCTTGGRLLRLEVPARDGSMKNVVWGCADAAACAADKDFRQSIVGRFGNRIAKGRFDLDGYTYQLSVNEGENHLHGGTGGFDKREWTIQPVSDCSLLMTRVSPDGEEGYPGNLEISVLCTLTDKNELVLQYAAVTDAPTVLNPTLHAWFNLHGDGEGPITSHILKINADFYTPVDAELIPTGEIAPVDGTPFDFRAGKEVTPEFDHNFVLRCASGEPALELYEPATGILLKVYTDQPGLQMYSGKPDCGLVLETQHFPDSPNHANFPSTELRPGESYTQNTIYHFEIR